VASAEVRGRSVRIDALRGLAIALVFATHLQGYFFEGRSPFPFPFARTWTGVDLFFVISGCVVTESVLRSRPLGFYIRRATRLLPVSMLGLAWVWAGWRLTGNTWRWGEPSLLWRETVAVLLYYYNFFYISEGQWPLKLGWYWSLSLEEQFYILFPPLAWWIARPKVGGRRALGVVALTGALVIAFLLKPVWFEGRTTLDPWVKYWSAWKWDRLLAGAAIAALVSASRRSSKGRAVMAIAAIAILLVAESVWAETPAFASAAVLGASTWLVVWARGAGPAARGAGLSGMVENVAAWLGRRAYGIYVIHIPVQWTYLEIARRQVGSWEVVPLVAITLVLAEAVYRALEHPVTEWGRLAARGLRKNPQFGASDLRKYS